MTAGGAARAAALTELGPAAGKAISGWERRRIAVGRAIEHVALDLFARRGIERVTVGEIAHAAGISERTFFRYFTSREDILTAHPTRALLRISTAVQARPTSESMIEAFKAAIRSLAADGDEQALTFLWGRVVLRSHEARTAPLGRLRPSVAETFREACAVRLRLAGRDEGNAGAIAAALGGVVGFVYTDWVMQGGQGSFADAIDQAFEALAELTAGG
jgi:AcrR family transcriptional regulator